MKRVALITGAGRGIGEATAQALARDGHAVALADLNIVEARRAARTLSGDGHEAFEVDVVDERSVEASLTPWRVSSGRLQCLLASPAGRC